MACRSLLNDLVATLSVRSIVGSDAVDYLRVLPYFNGLPSWEPAQAAWHGGPGVWPAPGPPATQTQLEQAASFFLADGVHTAAAFDGARLVGASAMLSLQITVPGPRSVPVGGVTGTGVLATHRRRGALRLMMQSMFDAAVARGEPLAALSASEGGIYGRFGFAPATTRTRWQIDRAHAALSPVDEPTGTLHLVEAAQAQAALTQIYGQIQSTRVGEIHSTANRWTDLDDEAHGDAGPSRYLLHRDAAGAVDGISVFSLPWSTNPSEIGTLVVDRLEAVTDEAYRSLWALLLDFDLTTRVIAVTRPADEPLRWMLADPRAMRITTHSDNLWLRILDVPRALSARAYEVDATLTFAVPADPMCPSNAGTWRLDTRGDTPTCTRVDDDADLTIDMAALGALYLGGNSPALLASAGLITPRTSDSVTRLANLLRTDPAPHNAIGF